MKTVWIFVIRCYQRWISPYKGFRCAHAAVHGELTCSEAVKRIIQQHGLWTGRRAIRQRLRDCRAAAELIRSQSGRPPADKPPVRVPPPSAAATSPEQPAPADAATDPSSYFKSSRRRRWLAGCDADVVCCCVPPPIVGCDGCDSCDLF